MTIATRLASGAVLASMALTAVPASALTIDLSGNINTTSNPLSMESRNHADTSVQTGKRGDQARSDLRATTRTNARLSLFNFWRSDKNDHPGNSSGSGWWMHGSGATMTGSGRVVAGYEKNMETALQTAATFSARMSKRLCAFLGEDGPSLATCMTARKEKIKASFSAMIDAAFTVAAAAKND